MVFLLLLSVNIKEDHISINDIMITLEKDIFMDRKELVKELVTDEGYVTEIYEDHLGYKTFGVGHLVLDSDDECGANVGTEVSEDRILECLEKDIDAICEDLDRNIPFWRKLDEERQRVVANMAFNLGINRLLKFERFLEALEKRDYKKSAAEMLNSRWAKQVGSRSERLKKRMLDGSKNFT